MMRRNTLNFFVDALTLLTIFAMIATGLVIRFVLPPGTGGRHGEGGLLLWGLGRHDWGDVHFWASVGLGVLLVIHVALHWSWVCTMVHRSLGGTDARQPGAGRRNAYGAGFLLAVVLVFGGFTWYASTVVERVNSRRQSESRPVRAEDDTPQHAQGEEQGSGHGLIRGSMTLAEVETATGVSVDTLIADLGLPKDTSAQEHLGQMAREYGFNMDKVRGIVAKHTAQPDNR